METKPSLNWIDKLPTQIREAIRSSMTEITFDKGEIVTSKGQPPKAMYEVWSGEVEGTYQDANGNELLVALYSPNTTFGELDICSETPRNLCMTCVKKSRLGVLNSQRFDQLREQHPEINHALIKYKSRNIKWLIEFLAGSLTLNIKARLASRLHSLAMGSHCIEEIDGKEIIVIPLTQQAIAKMIGVNRATINKILSEFESQEIVKSDYGRLLVLNEDALLEIVVTASSDEVFCSKK